MRSFKSEEKYDISKFLNFDQGVYDVINSPFLAQIQQLPTTEYYYVDNGFREIDIISTEKYGDPFFAYIIQFYNNDFRETFPEGTVLRLFSIDDLNEIYHNLATLSNTND